MSTTDVLVVDDDTKICLIIHRMLSDKQYEVQSAHFVADALGAIEKKSFDVYVLDYKLPDGSDSMLLNGFDRNGVRVQSFLSRAMTRAPSR
jgi:two-component system response regulator HydG